MGQTEPNSQIFADFCRFLGITALQRRRFSQKTADFRRKPQETADFRRNPFVPFSLSLLIPPYPSMSCGKKSNSISVSFRGLGAPRYAMHLMGWGPSCNQRICALHA